MGEPHNGLRGLIVNGDAHTRVVLEGELDLASAPALREQLDAVVEAGTGNVEIDMADVTFCDSSALSELLVAARRLEENGRRLQVVNPSEFCAHLLQLSGLTDVFGAEPTTT